MFELTTEFPLPQEDDTIFMGAACDGVRTYLSTGGRQIYILDDSLSCIERVPTYSDYHTLCYDTARGGLWVASAQQPGMLIWLSDGLKEMESVKVRCQDQVMEAIEHLAWDAASGQLYFSFQNGIYAVEPSGDARKILELEGNEQTLEGICVQSGYMVCILLKEQERRICLLSLAEKKIVEEQELVTEASVKAALFVQEPLNLLSLHLRLLECRQDLAYCLTDYAPVLEFFSRYLQPVPEPAEEVRKLSEVQMQQLQGGRGFYPLFPPRGRRYGGANINRNNGCQSCPPPTGPNSCPPPCPHPCQDCMQDCCFGPCCCQACADVIESIALSEASIAHVLNAEGEKLQKAIASTSNVNDLLRVNESVLKTIIHCTQLEQMLFYKLEAVMDGDCCCCPSCPPPCDCKRPC